MDRLDEAIRRCDAVVAAHPRHPQPRNERALLLSLAGRNQLACRDSQAAAALLARAPAKPAPTPVGGRNQAAQPELPGLVIRQPKPRHHSASNRRTIRGNP